MKINEDHLKPGTRILTTDKNRTRLVPGQVTGTYTKPNGKTSEDYYRIKLDSGDEVVLKYGKQATPVSFEVVHEGRKTMKKETGIKLRRLIERLIREESQEEKAVFSGKTGFMRKWAIPFFKQNNLKYKIQPDEYEEGIMEIWVYSNDDSLLGQIGDELEKRDTGRESKYGGWFRD